MNSLVVHYTDELKQSFLASYPKAIKTSLWLLKIMFPISFVVTLLNYFQLLQYISPVFSPLFNLIGLPANAALVFITSVFTNIYAAVTLIMTLGFSMRETILLGTMCLVSHNFIVETLILRKTGSNVYEMIALRLFGSFFLAFVLNAILPEYPSTFKATTVNVSAFPDVIRNWFVDSLFLALKVIGIVVSLMFIQSLLERLGVIRWLSVVMRPFLRMMGLSEDSAVLWVVANTLGLAYGAAVILSYFEEGKISKKGVCMLNRHLVISHSQLEDPLIFTAIGCPFLWMVIPRLILAIGIVWLYRAGYAIKKFYFSK